MPQHIGFPQQDPNQQYNLQHPALQQIKDAAQQAQPPNADHLRQLMYMLQAADALNTSDFLRQPGTFETDPIMKPFAKPGNPLPMLGAYGLEDLLMNILAKKNPKAGKGAELTQALLNAGGILKTNARAAKNAGTP